MTIVKLFGQNGVKAYPQIEKSMEHLYDRIDRLHGRNKEKIQTFSRLPMPLTKDKLERIRKIILKQIILAYENQAFILEGAEIIKLLYR